jgi:hypothetical protein
MAVALSRLFPMALLCMAGGVLLVGCCATTAPGPGGHHEPPELEEANAAASDLDASAENQRRISQAASEIAQMRTMIMNYQLKFGEYPRDLAEASREMNQKFPELDPWGRPYEYMSDDMDFLILSRGVDPNDKTDDIYYDASTGRVVFPDAQRQK